MGDRKRKKKERNSAPEILNIKTEKSGKKKRSSKTASQSSTATTATAAAAAAAANQQIRPSLSTDVVDEVRLSFIIRKSKKLQERKKIIARVKERREAKRSLERSNHHEILVAKLPKATRCNGNDALKMQKSIHQVIKEAAHASLTDNNTSLHETSIGSGNLADSQIQSLIEENKTLRIKLATRDAQTSLLDQHVNDLTGETKTLRKQLSRWQSKVGKVCKLQNKERTKFDRSTDLIAEARVGLTKALNDGSKLRAKIHDLDSNIDERNRRLDNLYDTIERQSDTIEEMNTKLRDSLTVFQLNENEKRKLEDEVAVLISSKDGGDIGATLRRLEQERQTWLWEREKKLEKARIELEDKNEKMLGKEKSRHQQELGIMMEEANRKKAIDVNDQIMQGFINQQLDGMKEANQVLQEKLTSEREESTSEIKEQDDTIIELENQVRDLQKMISNRDQSSKELIFRKAEVESVKVDLRDVRRQNKFLEKEMADLNKRREDFYIQAHGSQDYASSGNGARKTKKAKQVRRTSTKSLDQFLDFRKEKSKHKRKSEGKKNKEKNRKGLKLKLDEKPPKKKKKEKKKKNTKKGKDKKKSKKRCKTKRSKIKTSPDIDDDSSSMIVFKQVHRDPKFNDTLFNDSRKREKKPKKKSKTKKKSKLKRTIALDKDDSSMTVFKQKHRRSKKHNNTASSDGEQGRSEPPTLILCTQLQ